MMSDYLEGATRNDKQAGGAFTRSPAIGVLHTTEGSAWPEYSKNDAPHLTVSVLDREVRQHVAFTKAARSLQNRAGGVETNRAGCIQIEIIGTCDESIAKADGIVYVPAFTDDQLAWLASVLHSVSEATGVPLTTSVEWRDYGEGKPGGSYGLRNGLRLTAEQWATYTGWLGHMHVPENDHGDPGSLDVPRLPTLARAVSTAGVASVLTTPTAVVQETVATTRQHLLAGYPLPPGHWFGLESADSRVHSGKLIAKDRAAIGQVLVALHTRGWAVPDDTDGTYTRPVMELIKRYQADAQLVVDGKLGPATWTSISQSPIRR